MIRLFSLLAVAAFALSACDSTGSSDSGGPHVYKIRPRDESRIENETIEAVNMARMNAGLSPLVRNDALTLAAERHSGDMAAQNRPWHWGSDGSSPIERATRAGYYGTWLGENISETFEDEVKTLNAWMGDRDSRAIIMDPAARQIGFGWYQETGGKIWWTLVTGT
ncbi:CAP domain-containing protein [Tropicimonas sp.]|uniref:CAP domain-containing protein n=1 Tax=Tropicimonas sp. TaxID=2067044 RepID=UPI003A85C554